MTQAWYRELNLFGEHIVYFHNGLNNMKNKLYQRLFFVVVIAVLSSRVQAAEPIPAPLDVQRLAGNGIDLEVQKQDAATRVQLVCDGEVLASSASVAELQAKKASPRTVLDFSNLGYKPLKAEPLPNRSRWLVPVAINDKACKLLLDTGADFIILKAWAPEYLGLTTRPSDIVAKAANSICPLVTGESSFKIGNVAILKQHLRAVKLTGKETDRPATITAPPYCGELGLNVFRALGIAIDIRQHTLWIPSDPSACIAPVMGRNGILGIPLRRTVKSGHMLLEGRVGDRQLRMVIDSGSEASWLFQDSAEAMKLPLIDVKVIVNGTSDLNSRSKQGTLSNVWFGHVMLPKLPFLSLPLKEIHELLNEGETSPVDGIIGADVLEQGGSVIDVAADRIYFTGNTSVDGV